MHKFFDIELLNCIHIYTAKSNWLFVLEKLYEKLHEPFFFFFSQERGSHLKVFSNEFTENDIKQIAELLEHLPISNGAKNLDPLLQDVKENSILRVYNVMESNDFNLASCGQELQLKEALVGLSTTVLLLLKQNDKILDESKRINFAIQLSFIALIKSNSSLIIESLELLFNEKHDSNFHVDPVILDFYKDLNDLESEPLEEWVSVWMSASCKFYSKGGTYSQLIEVTCQTLDIRTFVKKLSYISYGVLKS